MSRILDLKLVMMGYDCLYDIAVAVYHNDRPSIMHPINL